MATTCPDDAVDEGRCSPVDPVPPDDGADETAFAPIRPGPIADGSQVLAHDGYDVQLWDEAARAYPRIDADLHKYAAELATARPLLRDLFWSFHQRAPQIAPAVPLTPAHAPNRGIVEQVLGTVEWAATRAAGTIGDPLAAALATCGVAGKALAALDGATREAINRLAELESGTAELFARAEALDDLAADAPDTRADALHRRAREARERAADLRREADAVVSELDAGADDREDAVRRAARQGLAEAERQIDALNAAVAAYGGHRGVPGAGLGGGNGRALTTREKIDLAQRVGENARLKQLALLCGRFTRVALDIQRSKVDHPPDEVTTIGRGADLARVLAGELSLLADPDLEELFLLRFAEQALQQYELVGAERQGRGPLVVALDESGSMAEPIGDGMTKEVWSKAVTLALLAIARLQRRDLAVLHFSGDEQVLLHRFPKGEGAYPDVIACLDTFIGGGTIFEPWMAAALELVGEATFDRADVIAISDGLAAIEPSMVARWNRARAARGMRAYAVLIGTDDGIGVLASITDALLTLADLGADRDVLATIFAV